jgi:hypothetical protein
MHSINPQLGVFLFKTHIMQKEYILCRFSAPLAEEITPYHKKYEKWAYHAVRLHNADIVANKINLDDEFWFLKEKIKAKCTIITMANERDFIRDDPKILKKLGINKEEIPKTSAHNRSVSPNLNKRGI